MPTVVDRGLEGVVVGSTTSSNVEGGVRAPNLPRLDIDVSRRTPRSKRSSPSLLYGDLPNRHQLEHYATSRLPAPYPTYGHAMQKVSEAFLADGPAADRGQRPWDSSHLNADGEHLSDVHTAIELDAKVPTIRSARDRVRRGLDQSRPRSTISRRPATSSTCARAKRRMRSRRMRSTPTSFCSPTSFNTSTFAARVAASTRADIYASVTAAFATLQGDLHGGAATSAFRTLAE